MTNQNVIISDPRSGFDSSLLSFSPAVPGPLPQPGRFIAVPAMKSFKNIDSAEAARITALLDSMRASSPTRRSSRAQTSINLWWRKQKSIPAAKVENNKFCLSVHFRRVEEKVLEVRPSIKWDKGKALEFLLESLGYANSNDVLPIYIGDDQTDEDAQGYVLFEPFGGVEKIVLTTKISEEIKKTQSQMKTR
ncbi:hypothetical protein HAX54_036258 [Datura stramonium]|uniref:Trehalose 6-phosphate phosphatase n=1 Tax=Datura stramonium TaxID=4076 RepID=A0ABS8VGR4_DATST|nr:hypothetical protein [Datura stramonium]